MNEEERQELETLRQEKRTREQEQRARTALEEAGIPLAFAPLLSGRDDDDTDSRTRAFCTAYSQALNHDIRSRLPKEAPVMADPPAPRPRRGIQRLR